METKTAAASRTGLQYSGAEQGAHTPGPWRHKQTGNMGNLIEGPSGRKLDDLDDGYRAVALVQDCCASHKYAVQEANRVANIALIVAAPDMLAALQSIVEPTGIDVLDAIKQIRETARAAIEKATGTASRTEDQSRTARGE
jgi:hypothetical protein